MGKYHVDTQLASSPKPAEKISFALCVDNFGVKYTDKADAQHLLTCLEKLYKCTTDWEGKLYL